jgi:hypothetical protein
MLDDVTNHKPKKWYLLTPTQKLSVKITEQDLMIGTLFQLVMDLETKLEKLSPVRNSFFIHTKQNEMDVKHTMNQLRKGLIENKQTISEFTKYKPDLKWLRKSNEQLSGTSFE